MKVNYENASAFEVEFHIQRARQLRSQFIGELFSTMFAKIRSAFHIKSHKLVASH